jgi:hypothetical protein
MQTSDMHAFVAPQPHIGGISEIALREAALVAYDRRHASVQQQSRCLEKGVGSSEKNWRRGRPSALSADS